MPDTSRFFFIIGAQRSATTYLYTMLDAHPQVEMAKPLRPEPKFFMKDAFCAQDAAGYAERYFGGAGEGVVRYGEKSTSYIESPVAAQRIAEYFPDATIVCVLRNPVDRAISNVRFSQSNGYETAPMEDALVRELDSPQDLAGRAPAGVSVSPHAYLARGRYIEQLERYLDLFPRDNVCVYFTEWLVSGPAAVAEVYDALGVDAGFQPAGVRSRINEGDGAGGSISPVLRKRLLDYFQPFNQALADRIGADISIWRS